MYKRQAFHGRTLATIAATGNEKVQAGFGPLTPGYVIVPFDDVDAIRQVAQDRDDIVAILVEPIQGVGGINIPTDDYLTNLRDICDQQNWLLMVDEIQSGMGRTGKWFAHQHAGIKPDVMSLAKSLGNGIPIGACLANGAAAELIQPGSHGTTFGGNPICCKVAMTVVNEIKRRDLVTRTGILGERMLNGFRKALHNQPGVKDIRGRGMMMGIELDATCTELVAKALDAGLLINVTAGNVVRLLPPYILTDDEADEIVRRVADLITDFYAEKESAAATSEASV